MIIWTIGAYGTTGKSFLDALCDKGIDVLVDTRRRAGMRGKNMLSSTSVVYRKDVEVATLNTFTQGI